jgi:processive 1,2-diacylglycerol beta-glucosyltransferase
MGRNGVSFLQHIFDELAASSHSFPVRYFFICGTNEVLKETLAQQVLSRDLSKTALSDVQILGCLSLKEMGEIMNISSLMLGKPGGSTVAECRAVGIGLLMMYAHDLWEAANARQLSKEGLLQRRDETIVLATQIETLISHFRQAPKPPLIDWQARLLQAITHIQARN